MSNLTPVHPIRITFRDYWSSLAVWMALGSWGCIAFLYIWSYAKKLTVSRSFVNELFWLSAIMSVFAFVLAVYRVTRVRRILQNGDEIVGRLVEVPPVKGRQAYRITCEFALNGRMVQKAIAVEHKRVLKWGLQRGDGINLVVDPANPSRVLIRNLFCQ